MARHGFDLTWAITENGIQGKSGEIADAVEYIEINITTADLLALGYVPEPVWRDAVNDPPPEGEVVLVLFDTTPACAYRNYHGMWFSPGRSWLTHVPSRWLPLPALPGKGE